MAFKRSAVRSRLSPPKRPEIFRFQVFFHLKSAVFVHSVAFFQEVAEHLLSAELYVPEFVPDVRPFEEQVIHIHQQAGILGAPIAFGFCFDFLLGLSVKCFDLRFPSLRKPSMMVIWQQGVSQLKLNITLCVLEVVVPPSAGFFTLCS